MAGNRQSRPPDTARLLQSVATKKPLAIVLAGHNGSGKSTLWYGKLADQLRIPLVNADRLTLSMLPEPAGNPAVLASWAAELRDSDERWQRLSQAAVRSVVKAVIEEKLPFAYETVFSYLAQQPDGSWRSKADEITKFHAAGYFVALLFVGLANADLSILRVATRRAQGGHAVPEDKLITRFPRTQQAIRVAAPMADLTLMFDNSRSPEDAFTMVRAQAKTSILYDCRFAKSSADKNLIATAETWLSFVAPL